MKHQKIRNYRKNFILKKITFHCFSMFKKFLLQPLLTPDWRQNVNTSFLLLFSVQFYRNHHNQKIDIHVQSRVFFPRIIVICLTRNNDKLGENRNLR